MLNMCSVNQIHYRGKLGLGCSYCETSRIWKPMVTTSFGPIWSQMVTVILRYRALYYIQYLNNISVSLINFTNSLMQYSRRYRNNTINGLLHILCILVYFTYNQYFEVFCYNQYLAPSNLVKTTISAVVWPPVQIRNCLCAGYAGLRWHLNSTNKTKKIVLSVKFSEMTQTRQKG